VSCQIIGLGLLQNYHYPVKKNKKK